MNIISFDVATKSLAVSIINYDTNIGNKIDELFNNFKKYEGKNNLLVLQEYEKLIDDVTTLYDNKISIKYLDVKDLIPDKQLKDTTAVERSNALFNYLTKLDKIILDYTDENDLVFLIEYQMGPNDKSRAISSQIMYHCMRYYNGSNIHLVGPSLKNKLIIDKSDESKYSSFIGKYKSNYSANKNHSKHNFLVLLKKLKSEKLIQHISKKNIDDIADSVLMSIAWVLKSKYF
jgi:hypothetical protein